MQSNGDTLEIGSIAPSIDELAKKFEEYQQRRKLENEKLYSFNSFKEEFSKVQTQFAILRSNIEALNSTLDSNNPGNEQELPTKEISKTDQNQTDKSIVISNSTFDSNKHYMSIREFDIEAITDANDETDFEEEVIVAADNTLSSNEFNGDEELFIKCKSTKCVMEMCKYCTSGEVMMIHYLSDQSVLFGFKKCYELTEDDSIVLSFDPKYCKMRQNHVMGSLAFSGASIKHSTDVFKPLNCYIPLSVIISKIDAGCGAKILERSNQCRRHFYIIWLSSPYNQNDIEASLSICGRDPINTLGTIIKVHPTDYLQKFMKVDKNFWRLSNSNIEKLSNSYRDDLHLKVRLTECVH